MSKHIISCLLLCLAVAGCGKNDSVEVVAGPVDSPEAAVRRLAKAAANGDLEAFEEALDQPAQALFAEFVNEVAEDARLELEAEIEFERALDEAFGFDPEDRERKRVLDRQNEDPLRIWKEWLPMRSAKIEILSQMPDGPDRVKMQVRLYGRWFEGEPLDNLGDYPGYAVKEDGRWKVNLPRLVEPDAESREKHDRFLHLRLMAYRKLAQSVRNGEIKHKHDARTIRDGIITELQEQEYPALKELNKHSKPD